MIALVQNINALVWGIPTLVFILVAGVYLSIRSGFFQLTHFPGAMRAFGEMLKPRKKQPDGISPYQALCTALSATVGTGNIVGVAGAITLGGPGAVFWMWVCAFFGMILKCAEASLAIAYRKKDQSGEWIGGPMYMIQSGLGQRWKWLAVLYAFFGVVAAFGVGNATQIHAVLGAVSGACASFGFTLPAVVYFLIAAVLAVAVGFMLSGGATRIGRLAERLVPYAALVYILMGLGALIMRWENVPSAFQAIFTGAFSPKAVTGGAVGSLFTVCKTGAARGIFTNEAGMGTASIAHAGAKVRHPVEQGLMGIIEVFVDTMVICTVTALVILCSGVQIPFGVDGGATLTSQAFHCVYGSWSAVVIALSLSCFALATVIGWGYYGLRCAQYLFGQRCIRIFILLQGVTVLLSAALQTKTVWLLAETVNGLMAIPNLIAIIGLSPQFIHLLKEYETASYCHGGTYENFHQCKSL